jgi:hypothetical protein
VTADWNSGSSTVSSSWEYTTRTSLPCRPRVSSARSTARVDSLSGSSNPAADQQAEDAGAHAASHGQDQGGDSEKTPADGQYCGAELGDMGRPPLERRVE